MHDICNSDTRGATASTFRSPLVPVSGAAVYPAADAVLSPDFIEASGVSPAGHNINALKADLARL